MKESNLNIAERSVNLDLHPINTDAGTRAGFICQSDVLKSHIYPGLTYILMLRLQQIFSKNLNMMKTIRTITLLLASLMILAACEKRGHKGPKFDLQYGAILKSASFDPVEWPADYCGQERTFDLIGGQTILMGSVSVVNDEDYLYVKYEADEGYLISETHLFIGNVPEGMPVGKKGNPKIGHFPFSTESKHGSAVVIHKIPLSELDPCYDIAAHAVVVCEDGGCEETAWGKDGGEQVFALKTRSLTNVFITGDMDLVWCENFTYFSLKNISGSETFDLINTKSTRVLGSVFVERLDEETFQFTVTANSGEDLEYTHLFVGSVSAFYSFLDADGCPDHENFPYINTDLGGSHLFTVTLPPDENEGEPLGGVRWGWYIPGLCLAGC